VTSSLSCVDPRHRRHACRKAQVRCAWGLDRTYRPVTSSLSIALNGDGGKQAGKATFEGTTHPIRAEILIIMFLEDGLPGGVKEIHACCQSFSFSCSRDSTHWEMLMPLVGSKTCKSESESALGSTTLFEASKTSRIDTCA
jgi:hypothetical protein